MLTYMALYMQNYDVIWRLYNFPNFTDDFHLHFCDVKQTSIGFLSGNGTLGL